jgi:hypothetical protein
MLHGPLTVCTLPISHREHELFLRGLSRDKDRHLASIVTQTYPRSERVALDRSGCRAMSGRRLLVDTPLGDARADDAQVG